MDIFIDVLCVGAGGTGGFFISGFGGFLSAFRNDDIHISFGIMDGDQVERKNLERQTGFQADDIGLNKAVLMMEAIRDALPDGRSGRVLAFPKYLDCQTDIYNAFSALRQGVGLYNSKVYKVLVGCVDNHRARQELERYFLSQDNVVYIDAANEYRNGEVITAYRIDGKQYGKLRSEYFPEVAKDTSPRASEQSCGVVNETDPQHRDTNHLSAILCVSRVNRFIAGLVEKKKVLVRDLYPGMQVFDAFSGEVYYTREGRQDGAKSKEGCKKNSEKGRPEEVAS